ncbi:MAG: peptidase [Candidatus Nitrosotenuis sp.]
MKNEIILLAVFAIVGILPIVYADVFVPEDEILGYFDSNGVYTVVGAVKNTENYPASSILHLTVLENQKEITITQELPIIFQNKDIPFKIKIPVITDLNTSIMKFEVTFVKEFGATESNVEVVYDRTLVKHSDGHLVGKIMNKGNVTEYNIKVYATIHGQNNSFIDVAKNLEKIEKIEPGQIIEFTMYPDPALAEFVHYYSCFALGDETIVPLTTIRNGEKFHFRYDSTASFVVRGFDETGTKLSILGINSFKFPAYVNFELPKTSENEKFAVLVNEKPVKFIQSQDEEGNWHIAFDVEETTQNQILISGFENPEPQKTAVSSDSYNIPLTDLDYSFLYYVIPIVVVTIISVYAYVYKKTKTVTS